MARRMWCLCKIWKYSEDNEITFKKRQSTKPSTFNLCCKYLLEFSFSRHYYRRQNKAVAKVKFFSSFCWYFIHHFFIVADRSLDLLQTGLAVGSTAGRPKKVFDLKTFFKCGKSRSRRPNRRWPMCNITDFPNSQSASEIKLILNKSKWLIFLEINYFDWFRLYKL